MTKEEIFAEGATSVYDNYVEALATGTFEALQAYSRNLSERIIPRGVETHEVVGIVLLLRDVLARSLFSKYQADFTKLDRILDAYEPAANRIADTVAVGFVQERERVIRQQQEAIRELLHSGVAGARTAAHSPHHRGHRPATRAPVDRAVAARHPDQSRQSCRHRHHGRCGNGRLGGQPPCADGERHHVCSAPPSSLQGLSPEIAQTLVNIGVDLGKMNTVGDLQGGIEQAERLLGYKVVPLAEAN